MRHTYGLLIVRMSATHTFYPLGTQRFAYPTVPLLDFLVHHSATDSALGMAVVVNDPEHAATEVTMTEDSETQRKSQEISRALAFPLSHCSFSFAINFRSTVQYSTVQYEILEKRAVLVLVLVQGATQLSVSFRCSCRKAV